MLPKEREREREGKGRRVHACRGGLVIGKGRRRWWRWWWRKEPKSIHLEQIGVMKWWTYKAVRCQPEGELSDLFSRRWQILFPSLAFFPRFFSPFSPPNTVFCSFGCLLSTVLHCSCLFLAVVLLWLTGTNFSFFVHRFFTETLFSLSVTVRHQLTPTGRNGWLYRGRRKKKRDIFTNPSDTPGEVQLG